MKRMKTNFYSLTKGALMLSVPLSFIINFNRRKCLFMSSNEQSHLPIKPKNKIDELLDKYINICPDIVKHGAYYRISEDKENETLSRVIARNDTDYDNYKDLYEDFIKMNHLNSAEGNEKLFEKDEIPFVKTIISNMSEILDTYMDSFDIQIIRNIKQKPYSSLMTVEDRKDIKDIAIGALKLTEEVVFSNKQNIEDNDEDESDYSKGTFYSIHKRFSSYPDNFPLLKEYGIYSNWPDDRLIYKNRSIVVIVNEEDHLKFKLSYNQSEGKQLLSQGLYEMFDLIDGIGKLIPYSYNDKFGYLSVVPSGAGNGLNCQMRIKVSNDETKQEKIKSVLSAFSRQFNNNYLIDYEKVPIPNAEPITYLKITSASSYVSLVQLLLELLNLKDQFKENK